MILKFYTNCLITFHTTLTNSADDKFMVFFLFFLGKIRKVFQNVDCQAILTSTSTVWFYGELEKVIPELSSLIPPEPLPISGLIQQTTNWWHFLIFPRKQDLTISNKLHKRQFTWNVKSCFMGMDTIYTKCQKLFSGKNKKSISKCCLLKILPRVPSVNKSSEKHTNFDRIVLVENKNNIQTLWLLSLYEFNLHCSIYWKPDGERRAMWLE